MRGFKCPFCCTPCRVGSRRHCCRAAPLTPFGMRLHLVALSLAWPRSFSAESLRDWSLLRVSDPASHAIHSERTEYHPQLFSVLAAAALAASTMCNLRFLLTRANQRTVHASHSILVSDSQVPRPFSECRMLCKWPQGGDIFRGSSSQRPIAGLQPPRQQGSHAQCALLLATKPCTSHKHTSMHKLALALVPFAEQRLRGVKWQWQASMRCLLQRAAQQPRAAAAAHNQVQ